MVVLLHLRVYMNPIIPSVTRPQRSLEVTGALGLCFFHSLVSIPVYVKQNISFFESGSSGRLDITVGPKQTMGKTVESVIVTVHMPKVVLSANLATAQGTYTYDPVTKVMPLILSHRMAWSRCLRMHSCNVCWDL